MTRLWLVLIALAIYPHAASSMEVTGFSEPSRKVDVAAGDVGVVASIEVKEGDYVIAGQELGRLDQKGLEAALSVADQQRKAKGRLDSAAAELRLREQRCLRMKGLLGREHASPEEVDRAELERDVAQSMLLTAEEDRAVREMEWQRIQRQLEQRIIRAPIDGVVVRLRREPGEFVSGSDPVVVTIVQLDPLRGVFSVPATSLGTAATGNSIAVVFGAARLPQQGVIEFLSPVTDAQSGTVQVKVKILNPQGALRSGEKCWLVLPDAPAASGAKETNKAVEKPQEKERMPVAERRSNKAASP